MFIPSLVTKAVTAGYRFFAVFLAAFLAFFAIQLFPPFIRVLRSREPPPLVC